MSNSITFNVPVRTANAGRTEELADRLINRITANAANTNTKLPKKIGCYGSSDWLNISYTTNAMKLIILAEATKMRLKVR